MPLTLGFWGAGVAVQWLCGGRVGGGGGCVLVYMRVCVFGLC